MSRELRPLPHRLRETRTSSQRTIVGPAVVDRPAQRKKREKKRSRTAGSRRVEKVKNKPVKRVKPSRKRRRRNEPGQEFIVTSLRRYSPDERTRSILKENSPDKWLYDIDGLMEDNPRTFLLHPNLYEKVARGEIIPGSKLRIPSDGIYTRYYGKEINCQVDILMNAEVGEFLDTNFCPLKGNVTGKAADRIQFVHYVADDIHIPEANRECVLSPETKRECDELLSNVGRRVLLSDVVEKTSKSRGSSRFVLVRVESVHMPKHYSHIKPYEDKRKCLTHMSLEVSDESIPGETVRVVFWFESCIFLSSLFYDEVSFLVVLKNFQYKSDKREISCNMANCVSVLLVPRKKIIPRPFRKVMNEEKKITTLSELREIPDETHIPSLKATAIYVSDVRVVDGHLQRWMLLADETEIIPAILPVRTDVPEDIPELPHTVCIYNSCVRSYLPRGFSRVADRSLLIVSIPNRNPLSPPYTVPSLRWFWSEEERRVPSVSRYTRKVASTIVWPSLPFRSVMDVPFPTPQLLLANEISEHRFLHPLELRVCWFQGFVRRLEKESGGMWNGVLVDGNLEEEVEIVVKPDMFWSESPWIKPKSKKTRTKSIERLLNLREESVRVFQLLITPDEVICTHVLFSHI